MMFAPSDFQLLHLADMSRVEDELESYSQLSTDFVSYHYLGCAATIEGIHQLFEILIQQKAHSQFDVRYHFSCAATTEESFYSCRLVFTDFDSSQQKYVELNIISWYPPHVLTKQQAEQCLEGLKLELYSVYSQRVRTTLQIKSSIPYSV